MIADIESATDGALKIEFFAAGEHPFKISETLTAIRDGDAEMVDVIGYVYGGVEPSIVVTDLPLLAPESTKLIDTFNKIRDEVYVPVFARWGADPVLPFWFRSMQWMGKEPIDSIDGLKGKNIRSWSPHLSKWIEILGGTPVTVAYSEAVTALATGLIEGMVSGPTSSYDAGFFDFLKVIQMWEYGYSQTFAAVNTKALAELDGATRDAFLSVIEDYKSIMQEGLPAQEDSALRRAVLDYGVSVVPVDSALRAEVREKAKTQIWEPWLKEAGPDAVKAYEILTAGIAALK